MKVAQYRKVIEHAERLLNPDYSACVGEGELLVWFGSCFTVLNSLSAAECKTAKQEDLDRVERVYDRFSTLVDRHFSIWEKAKKKYLECESVSIEEVQECSKELQENTALITKYSHEAKVWRSALAHWERDADEFTVRLWKRRLEQAQENLDGVIAKGKELKEKATFILSKVGC